MIFSRRLLLIILLACSLIVVLVSPQIVNAQASGLRVTPVKNEIALNPGETKTVKYSIKNMSTETITVKSSIYDFGSDGSTGNPQVIVDSNNPSLYSVKPFVQPVPDFLLPGGEQRDIEVVVNVPKEAVPGSYFGIIRFASIPQDSSNQPQSNVAFTASVAPILLVDVLGDVAQGMQLESITVSRNSRTASLFFLAPDLATLRLENTGNGFLRPNGVVQIYWGNKVVYSYNVSNQQKPEVVLPKSTRNFSHPIYGLWAPGRYKVVANISAEGLDSEPQTTTSYIWVIPYWFMAFLLIIFGLIAATLFFVIKHIRKRAKEPRLSS
jgi:hypothetical protein